MGTVRAVAFRGAYCDETAKSFKELVELRSANLIYSALNTPFFIVALLADPDQVTVADVRFPPIADISELALRLLSGGASNAQMFIRRRKLTLSDASSSLALLLAGCVTPATQSDVDAAIRKCGLEGQIFAQLSGRALTIGRLNPNADYKRVDCFLAEVRRLRVKLAIVGNEVPETR